MTIEIDSTTERVAMSTAEYERLRDAAHERDKLKRLVDGIAFMCEGGSHDELNVLAYIRRVVPA